MLSIAYPFHFPFGEVTFTLYSKLTKYNRTGNPKKTPKIKRSQDHPD